MKKPTKQEIEKSLKNSILDGVTDSAKSGITDNFKIPFALALGATNEMIGLITALPDFFGLITQFFTKNLINRYKSKKFVCNFNALVARIFWIPMMFIPFIFPNGIWLLLMLLCLQRMFDQVSITAWSSWMCDLVPKNVRGTFFGERNTISNAAAFITTLLAGWILGIMDNFYGFLIIFGISFVFSMMSNHYLNKMIDVPSKERAKSTFSWKHFIYGIRHHSNYSNFVLFKTMMAFAVSIASPFWIVYVLKDLNIGYDWYAISIAVYVVADMISQKYWGPMADRFGDKKIMFVCAMLLPFTALIMLFIKDVPTLMIERIFSAFVYAGFNIASFNYLLNVSPEEDSSTFIANYRFIAGMGGVAGPIVGGYLATVLVGVSFMSLGALPLLFLIAFFLRLITATTMLHRVHSIGAGKRLKFRNVFLKTIILYPVTTMLKEMDYVIHNVYKWEVRFKRQLIR